MALGKAFGRRFRRLGVMINARGLLTQRRAAGALLWIAQDFLERGMHGLGVRVRVNIRDGRLVLLQRCFLAGRGRRWILGCW